MIALLRNKVILFLAAGCIYSASNVQPVFAEVKESVKVAYNHLQPSDTLKVKKKYRDNISAVVSDLEKEGFTIDSLLRDSDFKVYEKIGDRFRGSAESQKIDINRYKKIVGFEYKTKNIVPFINQYSEQLHEAEKTYGISKYVIAAILGIESDFGKNFGSHNPFNAYVSMIAVGYRKDFAEAQLKELLEFTSRNKMDIFDMKSSYAGAVSYAQFIPYSLNKWFVGDDIFDMSNNIMSVANYLAYFNKRTKNIEKAVLRYNPSSLYVQTVMDLAENAEKQFPASE